MDEFDFQASDDDDEPPVPSSGRSTAFSKNPSSSTMRSPLTGKGTQSPVPSSSSPSPATNSSAATTSSQSQASSSSKSVSVASSGNPLRSALGRSRRQRMQRRRELGLLDQDAAIDSTTNESAQESSKNRKHANSPAARRVRFSQQTSPATSSTEASIRHSQDTQLSALSFQSQSTRTSTGSSRSRSSMSTAPSRSNSSSTSSRPSHSDSREGRSACDDDSACASKSSGSRSTASSSSSRSKSTNDSTASSNTATTASSSPLRNKSTTGQKQSPPRRRKAHSSSFFLRDKDDEQTSTNPAATTTVPAATKLFSKDPTIQKRRLLGTANTRGNSNFELLHDDCLFLCQAVLQKSGPQQQHPQPGALLQTLSDLVLLLSSRENRRQLFLCPPGKDDNALPAVLNVLASCAGVEHSNNAESFVLPRNDKECSSVHSKDASAAQGNRVDNHNNSVTSATSKLVYNAQVLQVISMILYFISLDCTLSEQGAPRGNAAEARRIRHCLLKHPRALVGILSLVKSDPQLASLRAPNQTPSLLTNATAKNPLTSPVAQVVLPNKRLHTSSLRDDCSVTSSIAESCAQSPLVSRQSKRNGTNTLRSPEERQDNAAGDDLDFPGSSQSSVASADPTKNGRSKRKRNRQQPELARNSLSSIPENDDGLSFVASSQSTVLSSSQSVASADPTKAGRNRRKKRRLQKTKGNDLAVIAEHGEGDMLSTTSLGSHAIKTQRNLEKASTRIMSSMPSLLATDSSDEHTCESRGFAHESPIMESVHAIPVLALTRILSGKMEWTEKSCLDDVALQGTNATSPDSTRGEDDEEESNPLLLTNRLLGENGAVPLLSQALAETHAAVIHQLVSRSKGGKKKDSTCASCLNFLHERVGSLTALVDEACLLNDSNREEMCLDGYTPEAEGYLIVGLVSVLRHLEHQNEQGQTWGEIGLEALRALTSLSHENPTAAKELEAALPCDEPGVSGLSVLTRVLQRAVASKNDPKLDSKLRYDSKIFCLNALTNCVESNEGTALVLGKETLCGFDKSKDQCAFLTWITSWLVEETDSFRDVVSDRTFGLQESKHLGRNLEKNEEDGLVLAGNGFVLLVCLLIHRGDLVADASSKRPIREVILEELPGESVESKMLFIKNTLTAFCNFYRYSIGDLSVAVVKPIKELIADMEMSLRTVQ